MRRWIPLLAAMALLAGCATHSSRYRYQPHPTELIESTDGTRTARAMVSIIGLRFEDKKIDRPAGMEVAVRIENLDADRVTFDPNSLQLLSADLRPFVSAIVDPPGVIDLPRGEAANVNALFPLSAEVNASNADFDGLNVRLTLAIDGRTVTRSATFERERYDDLPRRRVYIGYGSDHHRLGYGYDACWF